MQLYELRNEIIETVKNCHNESLSLQEGHVYQIWYDGEITLQKSGSLLNMRNMHCIASGLCGKGLKKSDFPLSEGSAYVIREDAEKIREMIGNYNIEQIKLIMKIG